MPRSEQTADGYKKIAEEFNRAGELAAKSGVTVGFHNHDGEFAPLGNTTGYDILLAEYRPEVRHHADGPVLDGEGRQAIRWPTSRDIPGASAACT